MRKRAFFISLTLMFLLGMSNVFAYGTFNELRYKKTEPKSEIQPIRLLGIIKEVKTVDQGGQVLLASRKKGYEEVVLLVNEDTVILKAKNCSKMSFEDLKVGMKIKACFGPMMTKSIPPQSPARLIVLK